MLKNCFLMNKIDADMEKHLWNLPLILSLPFKRFETSFSETGLCDPKRL